jgi:hypothetical protein
MSKTTKPYFIPAKNRKAQLNSHIIFRHLVFLSRSKKHSLLVSIVAPLWLEYTLRDASAWCLPFHQFQPKVSRTKTAVCDTTHANRKKTPEENGPVDPVELSPGAPLIETNEPDINIFKLLTRLQKRGLEQCDVV